MGKSEVLYEYIYQGESPLTYDIQTRLGTVNGASGQAMWVDELELILFDDCLTLTIL